MKKILIKKGNLRNALFVFFIAFSAFLAFEPLFKSLRQSAAQEFASAIFGTIFAAVITMVLLNKQTETEEEKSRSEKVFEKKLSLYNQAIDTLQGIFKRVDRNSQVEIERSDIVDLEFLLAKLIMVAEEKTIHEFRLIYQSISKNYSPKSGVLNLSSADKHTVFRFSDYCREELGLSTKNIEKEILEDIVLDGELFYHLEQDERFSPDLLSTLKDIYGYLVFEHAVPLQRVSFQEDGFEVYKAQKGRELLLKCRVTEDGLYVNLPHINKSISMRYFKPDEYNVIRIKPVDRNKFLEDFDSFQKVLRAGENG